MAASWTNWGFTEHEYFHDPVTGDHRSTPPVANGKALGRWENDLAKHIARCTYSTKTRVSDKS